MGRKCLARVHLVPMGGESAGRRLMCGRDVRGFLGHRVLLIRVLEDKRGGLRCGQRLTPVVLGGPRVAFGGPGTLAPGSFVGGEVQRRPVGGWPAWRAATDRRPTGDPSGSDRVHGLPELELRRPEPVRRRCAMGWPGPHGDCQRPRSRPCSLVGGRCGSRRRRPANVALSRSHVWFWRRLPGCVPNVVGDLSKLGRLLHWRGHPEHELAGGEVTRPHVPILDEDETVAGCAV